MYFNDVVLLFLGVNQKLLLCEGVLLFTGIAHFNLMIVTCFVMSVYVLLTLCREGAVREATRECQCE